MSKKIYLVVSFGVAFFFVFWGISRSVVTNSKGTANSDLDQFQKFQEASGQALESSIYTNLDDLATKVDFSSFLGKTVKIPIPNKSPNVLPGEDNDYLFITPPQPYKERKTGKIVWDPIRTIYLTGGSSISSEKVDNVKNQVEKQINYIFRGKELLLSNLSRVLKRQITNKIAFIDVPTEEKEKNALLLIPEAKADTTEVNANQNSTAANLSSLLGTETSVLDQMLDPTNPSSKQLMELLLLYFVLSQKSAEASNLDKETCLAGGGEWTNETCVVSQENQRCQDGEIDFSANSLGDGACHSTSELKETCQLEGGQWYERNNSQDSEAQGSAFCKSQKNMTYEVNQSILGSNSVLDKTLTSRVYSCKCPEGYCGDPTGKCISEEESSGDTDKDGAANGKDQCPKTASGESVNMNETSEDYGCSCTDLKKKGKVQNQACPASECRGQYWIQYPASATADQLCSDGFIQDPSTICVPTQTMTQQCIDQDNQKKQDEQQKKDQQNQMMQQAMKALQDLMKGGGGGSSGGGKGGSGGGGSGGGGGPSSPSSPSSPTTPSAPSSPNTSPPATTPGSPPGINPTTGQPWPQTDPDMWGTPITDNPASIAAEGGLGGPPNGELLPQEPVAPINGFPTSWSDPGTNLFSSPEYGNPGPTQEAFNNAMNNVTPEQAFNSAMQPMDAQQLLGGQNVWDSTLATQSGFADATANVPGAAETQQAFDSAMNGSSLGSNVSPGSESLMQQAPSSTPWNAGEAVQNGFTDATANVPGASGVQDAFDAAMKPPVDSLGRGIEGETKQKQSEEPGNDGKVQTGDSSVKTENPS